MSQIKCPYCSHSNTGQIPFCTECGKVLPVGDEMEVMAETIGASFAFKWVLVGAGIIFILSTLSIFLFKYSGMDLSFMRAPESSRLDEPGIIGLTPEWVLSPSDEPMSLSIRTMGNEEFIGAAATAVKICGKTVPVIHNETMVRRPVSSKVLGIDFIRYKVLPEETVSFKPPVCEKEGFYTVEVKFENGKVLDKDRGVFYSSISSPWYLFYTETGLDVLGKYLKSDIKKPIDLVDEFKDKMKLPIEDLIKRLNSITKEEKRMQMLSFPFWGLFILEMLAFFVGGLISSRLSPGITIKESLAAGVFVMIFLVLRNVFFFGSNGSYMVFLLLIMFPLYTAIATLGGYLGEMWQGVLPSKK
ncbi:MAG: hypothetical protein JXR95_12635 [Deltaproteobacteria bacterium]|nr:hypothetical protein [Deltaproteobacteria bacterium]